MKLLDRIERRFRWLAIANITLPWIGLQSIAWVMMRARPEVAEKLLLSKPNLLAGEWWRLFTFMFMPPNLNPLFLFFALYFLYLMGAALESHWGTFRYNLYLLIGYLATIAAVFIGPVGAASNEYIVGSIFLAFAYLYPDFEILLFFILPVRVKWLALITWVLYGYQFLTGSNLDRLVIIAAVLNFLLFFGADIFRSIKSGRRRMVNQMAAVAAKDEAFHRCVVCGATEKSHPKLEFRYCPLCAGTPCYCM
ncbi:MAG: rhomboid family intramembrane serine protease, partial [Phycisphaerae bacterium]|nr:rhomboid family intramembrane serine protease [Phycisphaerae bacterium]